MNDLSIYIIYGIGIIFFAGIFGLLYIHYFIKIPSLMIGGQRPSFWASLVSPFAQQKDSNAFLNMTIKSQDSYLQYVLKIERCIIYTLMVMAVGLIVLMLFID